MSVNRISELRKKAGMSQIELAKILSVAQNTLSQYETGKRAIDSEMLLIIAQYFNVSLEYLLGTSDTPNENKHSKGIKIPVLGKVQAGYPIEAIENIIDYEEIPEEMARNGEYFALQIKGNSMEPKFSEGDVVIVRKQSIVDNGDIAIVLVNGNEATVKKFYKKEHGVTLMPTNPQYDPMIFSEQEVIDLPLVVIGKVVELRAKF